MDNKEASRLAGAKDRNGSAWQDKKKVMVACSIHLSFNHDMGKKVKRMTWNNVGFPRWIAIFVLNIGRPLYKVEIATGVSWLGWWW